MTKYGAVKTQVAGITFASRREAARYSELKLLERAGKIRNLVLQKRYKLEIDGELICTYVSDFEYQEDHPRLSWIDVTEDAKGYKTAEYKIKKKLMSAIHGIEIREV